MKKYLQFLTLWMLKALVLMPLAGCSVCPHGEGFQISLKSFQKTGFNTWSPVVVTPAYADTSEKIISKPYSPYVLDTGDRVRILIYKEPEFSNSYTIDPEGYLSLPLIGILKARGKTVRELAEIIRTRLQKDGFLKEPTVSVDLEQNRPFFIHGAVKNAGQYPFVSNMSVETAVAIAGGVAPRGNDQAFRVTRRTHDLFEKKDVPGEYYLKPGDIVFVYAGL